MHVDDLTFALRRLLRNDEEEALRTMAAVERAARQAHTERYDRSANSMRELTRTRARTICIGESIDSGGARFPLLVPEDAALGGGHLLISGATGGGKTALAIVILAQLLARSAHVIIEPKSDPAPFVRDTLVPCLLATLPPRRAAALADRFVSLDVFDAGSPVPFQLLTRDPTLTVEEQAYEVTTSFTRTVGLRDIGPLQEATLRFAMIAAIEAGLDMADAVSFLRDDRTRRVALPRIAHPGARDYFERQFPRERASGIAALLNRLDTLLAVPCLRRLLTTPGMVRFPELLNGYVTVIDLGGAPAGMREVQRFIGELMVARLVRAVFAREVQPATPPVGLWMDEFQELLTPELASDAERILTLARSKRCYLRILHQSGAQFSDTGFLRIIRSMCNYHAVFRSDEQDVRHLEAFLPVVHEADERERGVPSFGEASDRQARRALLEAIPRLPDRTFLWWDKRAQRDAILARTLTYPFANAQAVATSLPRGVISQLRTDVLETVTYRSQASRERTETPHPQRETPRPVRDDVRTERVGPTKLRRIRLG